MRWLSNRILATGFLDIQAFVPLSSVYVFALFVCRG